MSSCRVERQFRPFWKGNSEEEEEMSTIGNWVAANLSAKDDVTKANTAAESVACFDISAAVFSGFVVVTTAPMDMIAMQIIGKWIELGERRRTTSDFLMPRPAKPAATDLTLRHSWGKVMVSPVAESMRAIRPLWGNEETKVGRSRYSSWGKFTGFRLL
jgi:hypothetical protein